MRLLLDTHVLLWALEGSPKLSSAARDLLADDENECWASSASVWEIAIKTAIGKVRAESLLAHIEGAIRDAGLKALAVTMGHAAAIARTRLSHGDPFDRQLVAQCEVETMRLLTADAVLARLPLALRC